MKTKICQIIEENTKIRSYRLEQPQELQYRAGQYMTVALGENLERDFTISASPTEKFLQFTTMFHSESDFKNRLWSMKTGDEVEIEGPKGEFWLDETDTREQLFLAGGIGVTPFRSMMKYIADRQLKTKITLMVSVKNAGEAVLTNVQDSRFKTQIIETQKSGRIDAEKIKKYCPNWQKSMVWVCGPAGFVDAMISLTEKIGLTKDQVRSEDFPGY